MRLRTTLATAMLVVVVGACASKTETPTPDPNTAFCNAVGGVAVAIANYARLGPEDTIDTYKASAQAVADSVNAAVEAKESLTEAQVADFEAAADTLRTSLQNLPTDVPVAEVQAQVNVLIKDVAVTRQSIGQVNCKEAAAAAIASARPAASAPAAASLQPAASVPAAASVTP